MTTPTDQRLDQEHDRSRIVAPTAAPEGSKEPEIRYLVGGAFTQVSVDGRLVVVRWGPDEDGVHYMARGGTTRPDVFATEAEAIRALLNYSITLTAVLAAHVSEVLLACGCPSSEDAGHQVGPGCPAYDGPRNARMESNLGDQE